MSDTRTEQALADLKRRLDNAERQLRQVPSRWVAPPPPAAETIIETASATDGGLLEFNFADPVPWGTTFDLSIMSTVAISGFQSLHHHHVMIAIDLAGVMSQTWISGSNSYQYAWDCYGGALGRESYAYVAPGTYTFATTTTTLTAAASNTVGEDAIDSISIAWEALPYTFSGAAYGIITY
jgi:hypothetical protein